MMKRRAKNRILAVALTLVLLLTQTALYAQAETGEPEGNPSDGGDYVSTIINPDETEPVNEPSEGRHANPPAALGYSSIVAFDPLPQEVANQEVTTGTPLADLDLPDALAATVEDEDGDQTQADVPVARWRAATEYDPLEMGAYTFTPELAAGYTLTDGVALPEITVRVVLGIRPTALGDVEINAANFPDVNFRQAVSAYDGNGDGFLSQAEIDAVTNISVNSSSISDLTGIEHFTALTVLACSGNSLTVLDLSGNPLLRILACQNNSLTALDLTVNSALTTLYCQNNSLETLDLSGKSLLYTLECQSNNLTALNLSDTVVGSQLTCHNNPILSLTLSSGSSLEVDIVPAGGGTVMLTSYNTSSNGAELTATANYGYDFTGWTGASTSTVNWVDIQISGNLNMTANFSADSAAEYDPGDVAVIRQIISKNNLSAALQDPASWSFATWTVTTDGTGRRISALDLYNKSLTGELDVSGLSELVTLWCYNNNLTGLNVSGNTKLERLDCSGNGLRTLDLSANTGLIELFCFDNGLRELNLSANTQLEWVECSGNDLRELNLSANTGLIELGCANNGLAELDLSANTDLMGLDCSDNDLRGLNLSTNTKLEWLNCSGNGLRTLDLSANTDLMYLDCSDNQLTALDVRDHSDLIELYCSGNQLTVLDVSNTRLDDSWAAYLECAGNPIRSLALPGGDSLRVNLAPTVGGTVMLTDYTHSTRTAELTATPAGVYGFKDWTGAQTGAANPLQFNIAGNMTVTANFIISGDAQTPVITSQPQGGVYTKDTAATLAVAAEVDDGGALSYQWYSNTMNSATGGTVINGATQAAYSPPTKTTGTIYYYVVVTNNNSAVTGADTASTTSHTAAVTVNDLTNAQIPKITAQPQRGVYTRGATATLAVAAEVGDGGALSYQWYSNTMDNTTGGTAINGATQATYSPPTTTTGTIYYYVVVTNYNSAVTGVDTASITSYTAAVTVNDLTNAQIPNITAQPQGGAFTRYTLVTLRVTAGVSDGGDLSYQWYSNTENNNTGGTVIPGAAQATFTPPTALLGTTYYYVVVTNENSGVDGNPVAFATSLAAEVTVTAVAPNPNPTLTLGVLEDDFAEVGMDYRKSVPYTYDGNDALSFRAAGLPTGLSIDTATGVITGRPADGTAGGHTVTVTVTGGTLQDSGSYTLTVSSASQPDALTMAPLGNDTVMVGNPYTKTPSVSYNGPDTLEYSATGLPAGLSVDTTTGRISGSPTQTGTYSITVSVRESSGSLSDSQSYTLTVTGASSGGGSSRSSGSGSSGASSTTDRWTAKTQLPASAFSWDGGRTLTIKHDSATVLGLVSVQWNGQTLTLGTDFTAHQGSVIIRFSEEFIAAQSTGNHTVRVEFLNYTGEHALTLDGTGAGTVENGEAGGGTTTGSDLHNPQTGDFDPSPWWWLVALIPAAAITLVSAALIWRRRTAAHMEEIG